VSFPNCWNGKDAYLPNNAHVAYGEGEYEGGACPEGYLRIPTLFMESEYSLMVMAIADISSLLQDGRVPWSRVRMVRRVSRLVCTSGLIGVMADLVRSNGDNHGFTYHADWINGKSFVPVVADY
jgi:hypothetical protein